MDKENKNCFVSFLLRSEKNKNVAFLLFIELAFHGLLFQWIMDYTKDESLKI